MTYDLTTYTGLVPSRNGAVRETYVIPSAPVTFAPSPAAVSASTGVSPLETSYSLYGHIIPLSVFGVGRIGGEIISGPWVENGLASFIISFGVPADPTGTRDLREIAFDSEVVWTAAGGFTTEAFSYRFYGGTLTQAADTLETTHFGVNAVAYRPQILLAFSNLPIANMKFKKIPYVSAVIGDASGDDVNLGEAFERLAYSPWVGYTSAQFETVDITDGLVSGGLIIAQDAEFLSTIQQFGRFYPTWDILQTDRLRIVDRGSIVTSDITLDNTRLMDDVVVNRQGPDTVRKDLELSTIDPDADYTIVPSVAQLPRDPVSVTTSVGRDTAYLPAIMDASTRISVVTLAKYHEEATRRTISGTAMAYGLEIEPGALVRVSLDDFGAETFKVVETLHGANYVVEFTAAAILNCEADAGACPVATPATFDAATAQNVTLSNGDLTVTNNLSGNPSNQGARVALASARNNCKYYFEIDVPAVPGGWNVGLGILATTGAYNTFSGSGKGLGGVWLDTGSGSTNIFANGVGPIYTTGVTSADTIAVAVDLDHRKVWVRNVPSGNWNGDIAQNPATNAGGVALVSGAVSPCVTFGGFTGLPGNIMTANFGASAFVGTVPTGFGPGWPV